jgi:hypothetical protein
MKFPKFKACFFFTNVLRNSWTFAITQNSLSLNFKQHKPIFSQDFLQELSPFMIFGQISSQIFKFSKVLASYKDLTKVNSLLTDYFKENLI